MRQLLPRFVICLVLVAITWAVFGRTLGYGFVNYDDPTYVSENRQIQAGLSWKNVEWAFTHVHSHNWHPLTTISHMLDCQLFGLKPGAHHFVNVVLHTASVILLLLFLEQVTGRFWQSAFVAAIFSIHPLHVESVAWIAERKDVLSGVFFMLTLLAYAHYTRRPTVPHYAIVALLFVCGLLSKPMLVTLPAVLLLLDFWPLRRMQKTEDGGQTTEVCRQSSVVSRLLLEKIPLFVLAIGSAIATLIAQRGGIMEAAHLPFWWRIGNAATVYLIYIWQMFWPVNLAAIYPHPGRLPFWEAAAAGAFVILMTVLIFIGRKRASYLLTGWLWYVIMLVPVLGLIQVGSQAHADRYTFLTQIGLYIAIVWGVTDFFASFRYRREIFATVAPVIIAALGWRAWIQTSYWRDTEQLWHRTIAVTGQNDFAHFALGEYLLKVHRLDDAIGEFQIVLARHSNDPDINFQTGYAFMEKGDPAQAISYFQTTLKFEPHNPEAETNLGNVLLKLGRIDEAVEHYRNVVAHEPSSPLAHYNFGVGLHRLGRLSEAIAQYKETLALDPSYPDAKEFLEQALLQSGQADQTSPVPSKP